MSIANCDLCSRPIDTDFDLDSGYVEGYDFVCEGCRDNMLDEELVELEL